MKRPVVSSSAVVALSLATLISCVSSEPDPSPGGGVELAPRAPCPDMGPATKLGKIGGARNGVDPAVVGISSLGVSASTGGGGHIAWAVGDRSANEVAGPDSVFLFALDAIDGDLVTSYPLDPTSFQTDAQGDPVTNLGQTPTALPDLEDLSIEYGDGDGADRIWLFDTGDNEGNRQNLNAYVVSEPSPQEGPGPSELEASRYPIVLIRSYGAVAANVEAAIIDPGRDGRPATAYLIPKFPSDVDGDGQEDDYPVFAFEPNPDVGTGTGADPGEPNRATEIGHITLDDPALQVTAASASQDGTALAVRAVSGGQGQPNLDVVALWSRDPVTPVADLIRARPTPDCTFSFDTAKASSTEETLAFDRGKGGEWSGFLWVHDESDPGAPLFEARRS